MTHPSLNGTQCWFEVIWQFSFSQITQLNTFLIPSSGNHGGSSINMCICAFEIVPHKEHIKVNCHSITEKDGICVCGWVCFIGRSGILFWFLFYFSLSLFYYLFLLAACRIESSPSCAFNLCIRLLKLTFCPTIDGLSTRARSLM